MSSRFVAVHDDGDLTFWILFMKNMYGSTKVTINTKDRKTMWIRIINWYELCVQVCMRVVFLERSRILRTDMIDADVSESTEILDNVCVIYSISILQYRSVCSKNSDNRLYPTLNSIPLYSPDSIDADVKPGLRQYEFRNSMMHNCRRSLSISQWLESHYLWPTRFHSLSLYLS